MAKHIISLLLFSLSILLLLANGVTAAYCTRCSKARAFVMMSCSNTRFPIVCQETLFKHVNASNLSHQSLTQIALKVSLLESRFTRAYLTKMSRGVRLARLEEAQAIGDCIDQINDSVAQLRLALRDLTKCRTKITPENFFWYMSNVATWTSTALTEQINCAAAFDSEVDTASAGNSNGVVRSRVRERVLTNTHVTSNALALVNRYVTRYRLVRGRYYRP